MTWDTLTVRKAAATNVDGQFLKTGAGMFFVQTRSTEQAIT